MKDTLAFLEKGGLVCRLVTERPIHILGGARLNTTGGPAVYERGFAILEREGAFLAMVSGWSPFWDEEVPCASLFSAREQILRIYRERAFLTLASMFESEDALVTIILRRGHDNGSGPFTVQLHAFERFVSDNPAMGSVAGGRHLNVTARTLGEAIENLPRKIAAHMLVEKIREGKP